MYIVYTNKPTVNYPKHKIPRLAGFCVDFDFHLKQLLFNAMRQIAVGVKSVSSVQDKVVCFHVFVNYGRDACNFNPFIVATQ